MSGELWPQVDKLFQTAVELDPLRRAEFLDTKCAGDSLLRSEVESLLSVDSFDWDLIETPALESVGILLVDEEPQLAPGQHLGRYEIRELIGKGGMGEVYLVRDTTLDRLVALKLLPTDHLRDRDRLVRFEREARTISALNHPNILTVHEFGSFGDQGFIATEFVDGETLRERLKRGPLPAGEVVEIAFQLVAALAAAHGAGVVHRDIKPENIMVRRDGYLKILDFGLAKLSLETDLVPTKATAARPDISSRSLLGTPRYMSPEQIHGLPVDSRSDIFSLGAVLHELLTGRPAFDRSGHADLGRSILNEEPDALSNGANSIPPALGALITKMLSKDRIDRYQNAGDILVTLKRIKAEFESNNESKTFDVTQGESRRAVLTHAALITVLALATILLGGGYAIYRSMSGKTALSTSNASIVGDWRSKAPLSAPRAAAGLAVVDGNLYAVGGMNGCVPFSDVEVYDLDRDSWVRRSPLPNARGGQGVVVLGDQIYAVGGMAGCDNTVTTVQSYEAKADRWSTLAPLPLPRSFNGLAAIDGKIFSIGGRGASGEPLSLNTRYDPQTDTWLEMSRMPTPRMGAGVAVLDGLVYVVGGTDTGRPLSTVEVYDPKSDSWTTQRSMLHPRQSPSVAELNGRIYSIGGSPDRSDVEVYDPSTSTWSELTDLPSRRYLAPAIAFNGSIYVAGGFDGANYLSSVLSIADGPSSERAADKCPSIRVVSKAKLPLARHGMTVGVIGGVAYVMGGYRRGATLIDGFGPWSAAYDPPTNSWAERTPMPSYRATLGTNSAVVGEKLYVIGGSERGQATNLNEMYDPVSDKWSRRAPMPTPRLHLAVIAHNGLIYAIGGANTGGTIKYANVEIYNPVTDSWTSAAPMPTERCYPGAVSLNGLIYVFGGLDPGSKPTELNVLEVFDPVTGQWTRRTPMIEGRMGMATGVLDGKIIAFGGDRAGRFLSTAEVYDPARDAWTAVETGAAPRANASAVVIDDMMYIFGGYSDEAPGSLPTNDALTLAECHS